MEIKVKYFSDDYPRLKKLKKGDWIDLRVDKIKNLVDREGENITEIVEDEMFIYSSLDIYEGDIVKFGLGVAMELPEGYEAIVVPRSSTFTHWGLIQTNGIGVIDNSYCGDSDEWSAEFIATRDIKIDRFDRVCQFRIQKNQPKFEIKEVNHLGNKDRGGFGTTGRN